MALSLTVLASGSSGNAALVRSGDFGILIDAGIGPRTLIRRLTSAGFGWNDIDAAVLTHTHGDHWHERALAQLHHRQIPIYCHDSHVAYLRDASPAFSELVQSSLIQTYSDRRSIEIGNGGRLTPFEVSHDSHRTFGFRIDGIESGAIGFAADLGEFDGRVIEMLSGAGILALECNHDETMLRTSRRPDYLIERILGRAGHLSNRQAGDLLQRILLGNGSARPECVVALHLSRECNRPDIAEAAMRAALQSAGHSARVVLAAQSSAAPTITAGAAMNETAISHSNAGLFDSD